MQNRIKVGRLLVIGLFVFLASCGSAEDNAKKILQAAPYKGLTDSIGLFPSNVDLYTQRAMLLSQHNQHELATADYRKAWELAPDPATALRYVSNLLLVNKPLEAVNLLQECIKKYPGIPEFRRRLSEVYAQTGNHTKALEEYNLLLQQDSLNFETWYEKGDLLVKLGDTVEAIEALEQSYRLQPINYTGLALANLYASTLNPKALVLCDELLLKDTTNSLTEPLYIKGSYYSDTKQYKEALAMFEECIRRDWKFTDAYIEKGIVLFEQKEYAKALEVFNMATTVSNTNADAWYWIGRCYEATGQKDLAIDHYKKALAFDKNFTEARERIQHLTK